MTSAKCKTGTDRVSEVSLSIRSKIYINVQGDEPILNPLDLKKFIKYSLLNQSTPIVGYSKIKSEKQYLSKSIPKIIFNNKKHLMYISRSPVPMSKNFIFNQSHKQVCIYSFPKKYLNYYGVLKNKTLLENIEDIEILRLLENGVKVKVFKLSDKSIAVDTLKDVKLVELYLKNNI